MIKNIVVLIIILLSTGCAKRQYLNPGAEEVYIAKGDVPRDATYIGEISGVHGSGCGLYGYKGTYAGAVLDLRNKAQAMGADYVQIMNQDTPNREYRCYDNTYRIDGSAYKTKKHKASSNLAEINNVNSSEITKKQQLDDLVSTPNLSYEEYKRRYELIINQ